MLNRSPSGRISILAILTVSFCFLSACTSAPLSDSLPSNTSAEEVHTDHLSGITVGSEEKRVDVHVDDEITTWLNTIEKSGEGPPPTPEVDSWRSLTMPSGEASAIFDAGEQISFDLLEILAYPEGLDDEGAPISVIVHPLCGPQADFSCGDVAWGKDGVQIPLEIVEEAIADTEFYAIGGILLPDGDSHPDSFMALLRRHRG